MKKIIFVSLMALMSCLTIGAHSSDDVPEAMRMSVGFENVISPDGEIHSYATTNENYRQSQTWKDARLLRNIGCATTFVGLAGITAGMVVAWSGINKSIKDGADGDAKNTTKGISTSVTGVIIAGACTVPLIAGAIMWGVGNHKMKKARLSYTGNGLSYNF